jgi:hypothetical protein
MRGVTQESKDCKAFSARNGVLDLAYKIGGGPGASERNLSL